MDNGGRRVTKSAPDYYSSVSIAGIHDSKMKPVLVDTNGQMYIVMTGQEIAVNNLATDYFKKDQNIGFIDGSILNLTVDQENSDRVIQGAVEGNFPVVALDANGIILSRMKGAASGDLVVKILDDCGDTTTITDWVESNDGLNPIDETALVKQGLHSMKLGIDADLSGEDDARWQTGHSYGDMSNYKNDWVYLWVYFLTLDYLPATGTAFRLDFGSDPTQRVYFEVTKAELSVGWNLLKFDLDNPSGTIGVIIWTDIDYIRIMIYEIEGNTTDFSVYVDCIMFVRPTPGAGTLKDIAVDENGILLSKMTGQYADILKPIAIDENGLMLAKMTGLHNSTLKTIAVDTDGVMKANLAVQSLPAMTIRPFYTETKFLTRVNFTIPPTTESDIFTISGQGVVTGGWLFTTRDTWANSCKIEIWVDGTEIIRMDMDTLDLDKINLVGISPLMLLQYNTTDDRYTMGINGPITFESSLVIKGDNEVAGDVTLDLGYLFYALIP